MSILLQLGVRLEQTAVPLPNPLTASQTAATAPIEAIDDLDRGAAQADAGVGQRAVLVTRVILAVGLGPVGIAPGTVAQIIGHHVLGFPAKPTWAAADDNIIWLVRLPRVLLGVVVGAALAATGVAILALVRNVLADPFLLGTASGASTGAAGSILSALTSFLIFASDSREGIRAVIFYLLGSLSQAQWGAIPIPAAGGADRIVATFDNTKDPGSPASKAVANPELASDEDPSTESVIALRPDLVVSYGLFDVNLASLQQAGAASLIVSGLCGQHGGGQGDGAQFTDIYHDIESYGRLFGTQPQAKAAVEQLTQRVAAVKKDAGAKTAAHGYFYGTTFSTSGNQSMVQSQLDALGLKNVFSDVAKDFIEGNTEELIKRDAQVMILTYSLPDETFEQAKAKLLALPGAQDMQAVRNNQVIGLPYTQTQATVSTVTGLETIAKGLQTAG